MKLLHEVFILFMILQKNRERINVKMATLLELSPMAGNLAVSNKGNRTIPSFLYNGLDLDPWAERIGRGKG